MRGAALLAVLLTAAAPPVASIPIAVPPPDPALAALLRSPTGCTRAAAADAIVVCGRTRNREADRQRLPFPPAPDDGDPRQFSVGRERNQLVERVSGDGMLSCASAVGPSGDYGCLARAMHRAHEQHPGGFVPRLLPRDPPDDDNPPP